MISEWRFILKENIAQGIQNFEKNIFPNFS